MILPRLLLAFAALVGVLLALRVPAHRRVAGALVVLLVLDVGRAATTWAKAGAPKPYEGAARAVWALDVSLLVAWYVVESWVVAGALWQSSRSRQIARSSHVRGLEIAAVAGAVTVVALALFAAYPWLRGPRLAVLLDAGLALAVLAQVGAAISFISRWRRPAINEIVAFVLAISTLADGAVAVASRHLGLVELWPVIGWGSCFTWITLAGVQLWSLALTPSTR